MNTALSRTILALTLSLVRLGSAAPIPMEPAERTLFVFVHGINPRSSGAVVGDMESETGFCVDNRDLLGRASFVWLKDLDGDKSDRSLFCSLRRSVFGSQYSLRAFTNPGESPVELARELGDRTWKESIKYPSLPFGQTNPLYDYEIHSHVTDAMRRYLKARWDAAKERRGRGASISDFEAEMLELHPNAAPYDLKTLFAAVPDSIPSRVVVFAHSMGGLTTREYMTSNFYNGDLDKVVTYDSPQGGSWVAKYNQGGVLDLKQILEKDVFKIMVGSLLMKQNSEIANQTGVFFFVSGISSTLSGTATQFSGYIGNDFLGNEPGNGYLSPKSLALSRLNAIERLPCESKGCRVPAFQLHGVDGVLAPDDPGKFLISSPLGYLLPTEAVDAATAFGMTLSRDWPGSMDDDKVIGSAMVAGSLAFGGWNYSQHGSLVVPLHSSRADGIPFLARPDVRLGMDVADWNMEGLPQMKSVKSDMAQWEGVSGHLLVLGGLSALALAFPNTSGAVFASKIGVGLLLGAYFSIDMGIYALANAPSHNANIWLDATGEGRDTVRRDDGTLTVLKFSKAEYDLYEAPYAQIKATRGVDKSSDSVLVLGINTGRPDSAAYGIAIKPSQFQDIRYDAAGWDTRWAVREEMHVPVQDASTRVRQVVRRNLPIEILTTAQFSALDFQVDDLRPDLMERMEIGLNWGMHKIVWDRDHDAQGNPSSTFTVRYYQTGRNDSTWKSVPNPIDAYGRWTVPLRRYIPSHLQVLIDGQNLLSVSLLNHVGKFSAQSQYVTFQAAPPVVTMSYPRPYQVVSDPSAPARFQANLLYYGGITLDTVGAAWSLTRGERVILPSDERKIPGLRKSDSVQDLELPLAQGFASDSDGLWNLGLRIQSIQDASKQNGAPAMRRFPFWLDRSAPVFDVAPVHHAAGEPWRFDLTWSDLPEGLANVVQLVRLRVTDTSGAFVAELNPLEFAAGGYRIAQWDGKANGKASGDGVYVLKVEGKDGSVPSVTMEASILRLRKELLGAIDSGSKVWSVSRDSLWKVLRRAPHMNWGSDSVRFVVDRKPPVVTSRNLSDALVGSDERLRIGLSVFDAGTALRSDTIRLRLTFRDSIAMRSFAVPMVVAAGSMDSRQPDTTSFQEGTDASGRLPDGLWKVTVHSADPDGNLDSVVLPWDIRIDRTAPVITFATPNPSYVSSKASSISGNVGLEVGGATKVAAVWKNPSGGTTAANLTKVGDGLWNVSYPDAMRGAKGAWVLEVVATDGAGNTSRHATFVQVDLVPPRLEVPALVRGPVVLKGLAMDPEIDGHVFSRYELSWREVGSDTWRHDGLRVPRGRGPDSVPWRSHVEQTVVGALGFWDPPTDAGSVVLRVTVIDDTGRTWGATAESYVALRDSTDFSVRLAASPESLAAGVGAHLGFDIVTRSRDKDYEAQVSLLDGRSSILWSSWTAGLKPSALDGRPAQFQSGSLHLWKGSETWTLRASGACRSMRAMVQTWSSDSIAIRCPKGWICRQDSIPDASFSIAGDTLQVNRVLSWEIPEGSQDSITWRLARSARIAVVPTGAEGSCARASSCPDTTSLSPRLLGPGELLLGSGAVPECQGAVSIPLRPGQGSFSGLWDGFRQNGNWPDGTSASLEADVWESSTGRVVQARLPLKLRSASLRLGAKCLGDVVQASDAPVVQKRAALEYSVEGRGAAVSLRILRGGVLVKTLAGSGTWSEGRPISLPYRLEWDGTDDKGLSVEPGTYTFQAAAESLKAEAKVVVGGSAWRSDSTLKLSIAQGEAQWSPTLNAWKLNPPPLLQVGTGVEARMSGGMFQYEAQYTGLQSVLAFKTMRPSLMIRRKRDRVKYGLLWKITTMQQGYDSDHQTWSSCGGRGGPVAVTGYYDGGVIEMGRGETVTREMTVHAQPNPGETTYRMTEGPHVVEYVAVPLSEYVGYRIKGIDADIWTNAFAKNLTHGSFTINTLTVTPTYGESDTRPAFMNNFASSPLPPRACAPGKWKDLDGDSVFSHAEWSQGACTETMKDKNDISPNRNLIWFGVRSVREITIRHTSNIGRTTLVRLEKKPSYIWDHNATDPDCAKRSTNAFSYAFDIKIPDTFFDAQTGVDNLANRLLRFDGANKYLYDNDAFLRRDQFDNDGNGLIDDDAESSGAITPFDTRTYHWRPMRTDPSSAPTECVRTTWGRTMATLVDSQWISVPPSRAPWVRIGEPTAYAPNSNLRSQSWLKQEMEACSTVTRLEVLSNITQDKLNFHEGDHSIQKDSLLLWFANQPEQGSAGFVAKVRQGDSLWTVDSRAHNSADKPYRVRLARMQQAPMLVSVPIPSAGGGVHYMRLPIPGVSQMDRKPVQFTVGVGSDIADQSSSSGDLVRIAWPLDSTGWERERKRIEGSCASVNPADPATCRRLYAAASGVRFGLGDSLDPRSTGTVRTSSAQESFFALRAMGVQTNPDGLPSGRIPSGSAVNRFSASLGSDAIGRSIFVDSVHFRAPWVGIPSGIDSVHATAKADGYVVTGPDAKGRVTFTGQSTEHWSLGLDPRLGGRSRLVGSVAWNPGALSSLVPLDSLYRRSAWPLVPGSNQDASLFREGAGGILSPNTAKLSGVRLTSPSVAWRDGSDAASVFAIRGTDPDATTFPRGLQLGRTATVRRHGEWIAVRGGVGSGQAYRIGWTSPDGGWRPLTDSLVSTCPPDSVSLGSCELALVDVSNLPSSGRLILRVGTAGSYRYHDLPFLQGTTLSASGTGVVRSLFGDAQVVFPAGSLAGKTEQERTIKARVLSPGETGLGTTSGVEVTGPVLEIVPSQAFAGTVLPEIVLRLPRASFQQGGVERSPAELRLYKIDAATGTVVPLESQTRQLFCDGVACASQTAWTEIEFHARTSSFSRFALMPLGVPDSRLWSVFVTPESGVDSIRSLRVAGVDPSRIDVLWDDDPSASEDGDPTPPRAAEVVWDGERGSFRMPADSVVWLLVRRRDGGLARTFRLERFRESFAFRNLAADTLHVGRAGSSLSLPYQANHRGELRLVGSVQGNDVAWSSTTLSAPSGVWNMVVPSDWEGLPSHMSTRFIATDVGGSVIERVGPVLVFDRNRPVVSLAATLRRERKGWNLRMEPTATDENLASVVVTARLDGRDTLGRWEGTQVRELFLDDNRLDGASVHFVDVSLEAVDRSGNRSYASWTESFVAPEWSSLLWLVPSGSGAFGWQVDDWGRHRLDTRIEGASLWREDALALVASESRVVTESVQDPGIVEATLELMGVWDSSSILLERAGAWAFRREGRDAVLQSGTQEVRWTAVFAARARWMHLALSIGKTGAVLYRDGKPLGSRSWTSVPLLEDARPWSVSGGGSASRLALVRVWPERFDSAQVARWRTEALGIDSVTWMEAEAMVRDGGRLVPQCELSSRMALATGDSARQISTLVTGPRVAALAGRWISDMPTTVVASLDGMIVDTFLLEGTARWGGLQAWASSSSSAALSIPAGTHRLSFRVSPNVQIDGVALVSGEGPIARWGIPEPVVPPPSVEVLVRDESPTDPKYLKPRIIVKNLSTKPLVGYRLHVQLREEAWKPPVLETWWPVPLGWSLFHDRHGLFTWTMDRSQTVVPSGQSDFGTSGASVGFHHNDWSVLDRANDPSWDSAWVSGAWTRSTGIPVFSTGGQLLSEWSCRDGAELTFPSRPEEVAASLTSASPLSLEGITARIAVAPEGTWNWTSTVLGISPLDGQPLSGKMVVNGTTWNLSGWWQQITIPNASRSEIILFLDLGTSRKVQLQKWQQ